MATACRAGCRTASQDVSCLEFVKVKSEPRPLMCKRDEAASAHAVQGSPPPRATEAGAIDRNQKISQPSEGGGLECLEDSHLS